MTSKNLLSVRLKENNKRRVFTWVVSFLTQLIAYEGILTVYLSRIRANKSNGVYATVEQYVKEMNGAVEDALGFQGIVYPCLVLVLAVFIGIQGFSYLYDRKKIDMYYSVPVSAKSRFAVVYINGILTYVIPFIFSILLALLTAAAQGALSQRAVAECALASLLNFVMFLVIYNIAILAVMLTGHIAVTIMAVLVFLFIGRVWLSIFMTYRQYFFDATADLFFYEFYEYKEFAILPDYVVAVGSCRRIKELSGIVSIVLPMCVKYFAAALVIGALAYFCYIKRPLEAAGRAIVFNKIKPFIKVVISVTVGLIAAGLLYDATYHNVVITAAGLILGSILCAGAMEVIYEFDIRCAFKGLAATVVSVIVAVVIFGACYFDIFRYDAYVPEADELDSVAFGVDRYSDNFYDWSDEDLRRSISRGEYISQNMFIKDVEAVVGLAKKGQALMEAYDERDINYDRDLMNVNVLYRLKSGRTVTRRFMIDLNDDSNRELLNRVIGSKEYKEGWFQYIKEDEMFKRSDLELSYSNGITESYLSAGKGLELRDCIIKDMEIYDYDLIRNELPCGYINMFYGISYMRIEIPIYEEYENTIAYLKENNAWYPLEIRPEDVLTMSVINHNRESQEEYYINDPPAAAQLHNVSIDITDPEEIARVADSIYPDSMYSLWYKDRRTFKDDDYDVTITFKENNGYPYLNGYQTFSFKNGKVPDFVIERTKVTPQK